MLIELHRLAEEDLLLGYHFYERQAADLGSYFLDKLGHLRGSSVRLPLRDHHATIGNQIHPNELQPESSSINTIPGGAL
jgi:hypothetical protein